MNHVLVVDDDAGIRTALDVGFRRRGWSVETAARTSEAIMKFKRQRPALVVTDIRMPDGDGFTVMRNIRRIAPDTAVILLTAYGSVPDAVDAMKGGACDYLVKPISFERLEQAASRVLAARGRTGSEHEPVGQSKAWMCAVERARRAATTDADVLIEAESGTGKELMARLIHASSNRRNRPFISVNCAAFPEALLESELFGHSKGAFTGADADKPGKFEVANGGTLLLDEIGEMPLTLQPKLLRVLQERELDRLGDTRTVKIDIRVIATTNRSLGKMVQEGKFRADLFYRLNVIPLTIPPLRDRREDVALMATHFARLYTRGESAPFLSSDFVQRLESYSWPGNVRELSNVMRRCVAMNATDTIGVDALNLYGFTENTEPVDRLAAGLSLENAERRLFEVTLEATKGNRSRAAELLGVSLRTVRNKIRDYGLPSRKNYAKEQYVAD